MTMFYAALAAGPASKALGLVPEDALALAIVAIAISVVLELFLLKSVRDRRVLGVPPVSAATVVLAFVSMLCLLGGLILLFG